MTRPDNPEPTEVDGQRGAGGDPPPVTVLTPPATVLTERSSVVTDDQVRPEEPQAAPAEPAAPAPAAAPAAQREPSGNGTASTTSPPWQRQRPVTGDGDPKTVNLKVGPPEHSRGSGYGGAGREQAERQPVGRAYGFSPGAGPSVAGGRTRQSSFGDQGSRAGDFSQSAGDFSQPTVRVGGHTPPEPAAPRPAPSTRVNPARLPRRANLQLQRLEPWSVLKLSLVLSIAGFLAWMVAVGVLYGVLAGMGVWDQLNGTYSDLTSVNNPQADTELISGGRVFGVAIVVGLVNVVLFTAMATVGSFVYNVGADLVGGVEVTLSESD